jgi:hypothetical protein
MALSPVARFSVGLLLLARVGSAVAAECNCKSFPYVPDPPCFNQCAANLLLDSDLGQLSALLKLPQPLAAKVSAFRSQAVLPKTFSELTKQLTKDEAQYLERQIRGLDQAKFRSLQKRQ